MKLNINYIRYELIKGVGSLRKLFIYIIVFITLVTSCTLLLIAARELPQDRIEHNFMDSTGQFKIEQYYGKVINSSKTRYQLDNCSEILILYQSVYLNKYEPLSSIYANGTFYEQTEGTMDGCLELYTRAITEHKPSNSNYIRYWQGFRVPVRFMLTFLNYTEIRELLMWIFILLFSSALLLIYRQTRKIWIPLIFALCIALSNPIVLFSSLQYSCCYLLAFIGILGLPIIIKKPKFTGLFFFIMGALTQYFDFYTTPFITCGLPLVTLMICLIYKEDVTARNLVKLAVRCILLWFAAYVLMWAAKLALASLFTETNGFENGISSFLFRIGVDKREDLMHYYSPLGALGSCMISMLDVKMWIVLVGAWFIALTVILVSGRSRKHFGRAAVFSIIAALPVIWILVSAQPSYIHSFFQHRVLCVSIFSMLCVLVVLHKDTRKEKSMQLSKQDN